MKCIVVRLSVVESYSIHSSLYSNCVITWFGTLPSCQVVPKYIDSMSYQPFEIAIGTLKLFPGNGIGTGGKTSNVLQIFNSFQIFYVDGQECFSVVKIFNQNSSMYLFLFVLRKLNFLWLFFLIKRLLHLFALCFTYFFDIGVSTNKL